MGDDIGSCLSSMAICLNFRSTKVVQLSNQNTYFYQFWCHYPLITQPNAQKPWEGSKLPQVCKKGHFVLKNPVILIMQVSCLTLKNLITLCPICAQLPYQRKFYMAYNEDLSLLYLWVKVIIDWIYSYKFRSIFYFVQILWPLVILCFFDLHTYLLVVVVGMWLILEPTLVLDTDPTGAPAKLIGL